MGIRSTLAVATSLLAATSALASPPLDVQTLVAPDGVTGDLFGAHVAIDGDVAVDGEDVSFGHPADAIARGLVFVPGDRAEGLLPQRSVRENVALGARLRGEPATGSRRRPAGRFGCSSSRSFHLSPMRPF